MPSDPKVTPQSLAQQALGLAPTTVVELAGMRQTDISGGSEAAALTQTDVGTLIELYFACEDADERDIVFDRLRQADAAETHDFFVAMMHHDEDVFLREAAAEALAQQGNEEAVQVLLQLLQEGGDVTLFELVIAGLLPILKQELFDTLHAVWRADGREPAERRAAMLGMERADAQRTTAAMRDFINSLTDPRTMPEDQVEIAMGILARHPHAASLAALEGLGQKIDRLTCVDADAVEDRTELRIFIDEGIALLQSALTPA